MDSVVYAQIESFDSLRLMKLHMCHLGVCVCTVNRFSASCRFFFLVVVVLVGFILPHYIRSIKGGTTD